MDSISNFLSELLGTGAAGPGFGQALIAVAIAYVGGVLSSLTPCVYPMIPITMSVVGGMTEVAPGAKRGAHPWKDLLARSAAYLGGMTLVYSVLGVLAGVTGRLFGSLTNTPGWYLALGAIITAAALVMLDVLPFDPAAWWDAARRRWRHSRGHPHPLHSSAHHKGVTWVGAFALGASSGFIAAPCTTPVLTAILAYIAKSQSVGLGLALMISFSLGLGTLLLGVALFTGALQILPRSGSWMKTVKTASGILLLAFAQYLIFKAGGLSGP